MYRSHQRLVHTNGVTLRLTEAGDPGAPVILLAHGFPELAYSWRHQIPELAAAGYHVLAPDQRGYGGSSRPEPVEAYDIAHLTADLTGLLDDVGVEKAVVIGHDWGATVAAGFALLHPDRISALAVLSVPPTPRPPAPPMQILARRFGESFFYMLYFQQVGPADTELGSDPATAIRRMLSGLRDGDDPRDQATTRRLSAPGPQGFIERLPEPDRTPDWITDDDIDYYIAEFTRTGFTGGLNWYRNWHLLADAPISTIRVPTLFLAGTADFALRNTPRQRITEIVTGPYREVMIDGAGHWVQQERPSEVNTALLDFLRPES
ncbi:alpha/beta fold hydrolase [Nocardia carnea]|uniref:alpha/beta fold hydrolase n=1 Tax=Nocardia carnea TaxID=37328 RepID=UPI0024544853|nr:alpha/beta hydrolase [Nocardia carnea]